MALTPAERAKRYHERQKSDPTLKENYLRREKERKKISYVPVSKRTERARRKIRRSWRKSSKEKRDKKSSAKSLPGGSRERTTAVKHPNPPFSDKRKELGRKKVKRDRAKAYRQLQKTRQLLEMQRRLTEKWKRRHIRVKEQLSVQKDSPRSKTKKLLRHFPLDSHSRVYKKLVFHHVLVDELRRKYRKARHLRLKQKIRRIAAGKVVKKYRLLKHMSNVLGVNAARLAKKDVQKSLKFVKSKRSDRLADDIKQKVTDYFLRDDVSRQLPGKKDAVTRKKIKKQKRLLNQHMTILHAQFVAENPEVELHYSTFCKLRPWWVLVPKLSDLDTCMCKRCANMDLMNQRLSTEKVTSTAAPPLGDGAVQRCPDEILES